MDEIFKLSHDYYGTNQEDRTRCGITAKALLEYHYKIKESVLFTPDIRKIERLLKRHKHLIIEICFIVSSKGEIVFEHTYLLQINDGENDGLILQSSYNEYLSSVHHVNWKNNLAFLDGGFDTDRLTDWIHSTVYANYMEYTVSLDTNAKFQIVAFNVYTYNINE